MAISLLEAKNEYQLAFLQACKESAVEIPLEAIKWPEESEYYFSFDTDGNTSCTLKVNTDLGYKFGDKNTITIRWKVISKPDDLYAMVPKCVFEEYTEDQDLILETVRKHVQKYFAHPLDKYSSRPTVKPGAVEFYFDKSAVIRHWKSQSRYWQVAYEMPSKPIDNKDLTGKLPDGKWLAADAFTSETLISGIEGNRYPEASE